MKKAQTQNRNFETSLTSLEKIVRELERGDLPLEKGLELFEEGVKLSRECQERLSEAERRIEVLLRDGEGRPVLQGVLAEDEEELTPDFGGTDEDDENVF
ncbi:MAG: exodeoxyribonuclease VII small subunit [Acidobacteriota bacterium]|nr:exodeoxyribonuclease VII small subunit [Acidobacteriota bacterium]MDQ3586595.1 exodeoxyribonuclease VII small subunit [Acidobacteriota bacterium]